MVQHLTGCREDCKTLKESSAARPSPSDLAVQQIPQPWCADYIEEKGAAGMGQREMAPTTGQRVSAWIEGVLRGKG